MLLFALLVWACAPSATNNTNKTGNTNTANTSNANKAALACDDTQVIKDIKATIEADYPLLKSRMDQLSAYSKACTVSLMGYTDTIKNFKDFYTVASDTPNVVKVNIDLLFIEKSQASTPEGGQCPAGQQACGDICVPMGQCWAEISVQNANANSNTKSNTNSANSNANSNANAKP